MNRIKCIFILILIYIRELTLANFRLAREVLRIKLTMHPSMVKIPISFKSHFELLLLAHLITITPGTLSVDYLEEDKSLLIHLLFSEDTDVFVEEMLEKWQPLIRGIFE